jgi:hypothetical protein
MRSVQLRSGRILALAAVALSAPWLAVQSAPADAQPVSAGVGTGTFGRPLAPGFLGFSIEFNALQRYTGDNPRTVNPVFAQLLRNLTPRQPPVLRIGGNSTDNTWWPLRSVTPPGGITFTVTNGWLATTRALAAELGAQLILGVNLVAGHPAFAAAEARHFLQGIGPRYIQALEIGNEPDLYPGGVWYHDRTGRPFLRRPSNYRFASFLKQFARWRAALPRYRIAGPASAGLRWLSGLGQLLAREPDLGVATIHRYPLINCVQDPNSPAYPTIPRLLSDPDSTGLAQGVAPYVAVAHHRRVPVRIGELNSASCEGRRGISDTFASALWMLDTLFNLASVGVDGVNVHTLPGAVYEPFTFTRSLGRWQAFVHPDYYGMLMFGQAFPPAARLLHVSAPSGPVKVWATRAPDGHTRVVLINKDPANPYRVKLQVPGADIAGQASLVSLQAPSVSSTSGVTLGGQTFGDQTTTGSLGKPHEQTVLSVAGSYTVEVPAASAALLTQWGPRR